MRHAYFTVPSLCNPPYLPQRATPDGPLLDLGDHVRHLVRCARQGAVPVVLVLPYWNSSDWFHYAKSQPDIALIKVVGPTFFLRGPVKQMTGQAPFDLLLLVIGAHSATCQASFDGKTFSFPSGWVEKVIWYKTNWLPAPQVDPELQFDNWEEFYSRTEAATRVRKARTPVCNRSFYELELAALPKLAPLTGNDAFQTLQLHVSPPLPGTPLRLTPKSAEAYRQREEKRLGPRQSSWCSKCHSSDHSTSECWRFATKEMCYSNSSRMNTLIDRVFDADGIDGWPNRPKKPPAMH